MLVKMAVAVTKVHGRLLLYGSRQVLDPVWLCAVALVDIFPSKRETRLLRYVMGLECYSLLRTPISPDMPVLVIWPHWQARQLPVTLVEGPQDYNLVCTAQQGFPFHQSRTNKTADKVGRNAA